MARVTLNKSGTLWRGENFTDLVEFIRSAFQADGYPTAKVAESVCGRCDGRVFRVHIDDGEGCAQRVCVACGHAVHIADSAEYWEEADLGVCECPCGGDEFEVAVGFALRGDGDVRWVCAVWSTTLSGSTRTGRSTTARRGIC
jgi:hypothetical protein